MSNYETIQLRAANPLEVRTHTQQMTSYFESEDKEVISHSVYWDHERKQYIISMIGKNKS